MLFKSPDSETEFNNAPDALKSLADYFVELSLRLGVVPVVTRILEKVDGESGVHQDYRAIDFRDEMGVGGPRLYTDLQVSTIVSEMNAKFPRNDGKLVCIHHAFVNHSEPNSKRAPYHFHVQAMWQWKTDPMSFQKQFMKVTLA